LIGAYNTPNTPPEMPIDVPPMQNLNTANRVTATEPDFGGFGNAPKGQLSNTLMADIQRKQMPYSLYNKSLLGG